jgi:hypothetical protein
MQKVVFSTDELPAELDNRARMARWRDAYPAVNSFDCSYLDDKQFSMQISLAAPDRGSSI